MPSKRYISWNEYINSILELAANIHDTEDQFEFVYGIPTAGTPIAFFLSKLLNIKFLTEIKPYIVDKVNRYLIVDEIVDTGQTFINFADDFDRRIIFRTACLHRKEHAKFMPYYLVEQKNIPTDCWTYYPYEDSRVDASVEIEAHLKKSLERRL